MRLHNSIHDEIGNRSFACWFCLDLLLEIAVQTYRSKGMYKGNRRKEFVRAPKTYAYSELGTAITAKFWIYVHVTAEKRKTAYHQKITAVLHYLKIPLYFGFTASAKVITAEKWKTAYRQKITAVLHYRRKNTAIFLFHRFRQSGYRQKRENRQPPKNYRLMAIPPRLRPPKKTLPTTTRFFFGKFGLKGSHISSEKQKQSIL